ncbi:MAG: O-antigen ligase family protein, partial [Candidatus Hydrogenedentes bacterium]|nr:O-antigen ligase family protein [Candidatus Hydrogenedentota bacterium]
RITDPTGNVKWLIVHWTALLLAFGWILYGWRLGVRLKFPRVFGGLWAAFLAVYFLAAVLSPFFNISLLEFANFFSLFVIYFVAAQVFHTEAQVARLLGTVCFAAALSSCYGMAQKLGWDPFPWQDRETDVYLNLPATYGNPNFAAHTLILAIIFALYLLAVWRFERRGDAAETLPDATDAVPSAASKASVRPVLLGLGLGLFVLHLFFTEQRAGLIALAAAGVLLLVARLVGARISRPGWGAAATLALMVVLGLGVVGGATLVSQRITGSPFPLDTSILIRYQSYVSGTEMLREKPLFGHGPGVYAMSYPKYWTPIEQQWFAQERMMNAHVHNDLMELTIDGGLLVAGIYLTVLVVGMAYGLVLAFSPGAPPRKLLGYAAASFFCAFFVDGLFGFNLRVPVSASLLFLFSGALEGLWLPAFVPASADNRTFISKPWRVAAVFALPILVSLQTRVFLSELHHFRGIVRLNQNDFAGAQADFRKGAKHAPWNWELARREGLVALQQGHVREAIIHLQRSLMENPYYVLSLLAQAHARLMLAQQQTEEHPDEVEKSLTMLEEAKVFADRALDISPLDPGAEDLLGRIASIGAIVVGRPGTPEAAARAAEYWQDAEKHLARAVELQADNSDEIYRMLAKVRVALEDAPGAEEALSHAVESAPSRPELWEEFMAFARQFKRYDRVRSTLKVQLSRLDRAEKPDVEAIATTYLGLGRVEEEGYGDLEKADAAMIHAVLLASWRADIWGHFGDYIVRQHRLSLLEDAVRQYMSAKQEQGQAPLPQVALLSEALAGPPEALNDAGTKLLGLLQTQPDLKFAASVYGWVARLLAEHLEQTGAVPSAVCTAYYSLGVVLNRIEDQERALPLLAAAAPCVTAEQQPLLAVHRGDALIRLERPTEAIGVLRAAAQAYPQNLDVRWAFAQGLARVGLKEEARAAYEELIKEPFLDPRGQSILQQELEQL